MAQSGGGLGTVVLLGAVALAVAANNDRSMPAPGEAGKAAEVSAFRPIAGEPLAVQADVVFDRGLNRIAELNVVCKLRTEPWTQRIGTVDAVVGYRVSTPYVGWSFRFSGDFLDRIRKPIEQIGGQDIKNSFRAFLNGGDIVPYGASIRVSFGGVPPDSIFIPVKTGFKLDLSWRLDAFYYYDRNRPLDMRDLLLQADEQDANSTNNQTVKQDSTGVPVPKTTGTAYWDSLDIMLPLAGESRPIKIRLADATLSNLLSNCRQSAVRDGTENERIRVSEGAALRDRGLAAIDTGKFDTAREALLGAVSFGVSTEAIALHLATMFHDGQGGTVDATSAHAWYREAAETWHNRKAADQLCLMARRKEAYAGGLGSHEKDEAAWCGKASQM